MVAAPVNLIAEVSEDLSLEAYLLNPPERTEWVNGQLVEKQGMTAKHGRIQARLARYWGNYVASSQAGGEVYTETTCRTIGRGRCPDVAYLKPELVAQYGNFNSLPQSFSLIAEIISPTDLAEQVFGKVKEYLGSGCEESWLIFPESELIFVITESQQIMFTMGQVAQTQKVLTSFNVPVSELLA